jgi:hypothetical protein
MELVKSELEKILGDIYDLHSFFYTVSNRDRASRVREWLYKNIDTRRSGHNIDKLVLSDTVNFEEKKQLVDWESNPVESDVDTNKVKVYFKKKNGNAAQEVWMTEDNLTQVVLFYKDSKKIIYSKDFDGYYDNGGEITSMDAISVPENKKITLYDEGNHAEKHFIKGEKVDVKDIWVGGKDLDSTEKIYFTDAEITKEGAIIFYNRVLDIYGGYNYVPISMSEDKELGGKIPNGNTIRRWEYKSDPDKIPVELEEPLTFVQFPSIQQKGGNTCGQYAALNCLKLMGLINEDDYDQFSPYGKDGDYFTDLDFQDLYFLILKGPYFERLRHPFYREEKNANSSLGAEAGKFYDKYKIKNIYDECLLPDLHIIKLGNPNENVFSTLVHYNIGISKCDEKMIHLKKGVFNFKTLGVPQYVILLIDEKYHWIAARVDPVKIKGRYIIYYMCSMNYDPSQILYNTLGKLFWIFMLSDLENVAIES